MKHIHDIVFYFLYLAMLIIVVTYDMKQHNTINELKNKVDYLELQLKEAEEKNARRLDACLDIVANGRWQ